VEGHAESDGAGMEPHKGGETAFWEGGKER